ncbi:hypothetical protein UFOVP313_22 [uncultured Caudovirales phage]|uniref:Uncharacterized protein n=1 Tax=uncultured Caudovirales phage TaxID=2100421 RepID=A0A6J5LYU0_9CAUD|nr:hypothetical protein UFOVP313_22 [uncultured Caudovirales phage]
MIESFKKLGVESIFDAHDVMEFDNARKKIFLFLARQPNKTATAEQVIRASGIRSGDRRARELRDGYTTEKLRPQGRMLWLKVIPVRAREFNYQLISVTWEEWVRLRQQESGDNQQPLLAA